MKLLIPTLAALVLSIRVLAGPLAPDDAAALQKRTKLVAAAFDAADADTIVEMTHPSLFKLVGSKEKMLEVTKAAMAQIKALDFQVLESTLGTPGEAHVAADELVCFYPRTTVVRIAGKKAKSVGFLICVRKAGGGEWLFLDGSGLRRNPELLAALLPALPPDVTLPENKVELVE